MQFKRTRPDEIRVSAIVHLRYVPGKIRTLKRRIQRDRETLKKIQNDILYADSQRGRLIFLQRMIAERIERNVEKLNQLRLEKTNAQEKMQEALA
jgi:cob(I)alamin adenosyltransferase